MDVATALGTYLEIADSVAAGLIEGLYVVGSFALDDWHEGRSDINIIATMAEPATDQDFGLLRTMHALLWERQPLPHIDGLYLAWADLTVPPGTGLHRPWALVDHLFHDGECPDVNPITWYTLATYGVTVRGPATERLNIALDTEERVRFAIDNLLTFWSTLADMLERDSQDPDAVFDIGWFEWCALGALREHYTAFTGDVTSKSGAGDYGLVVTPDHMHDTLRAALNARATGGGDATREMMLSAADVIMWAVNEVRPAAV